MAVKKIRLFKIASEINIGKETIVEYLQSKGFDIQNKPTSILTEEMMDAVFEKFKKEMQAAESQRKKIKIHKDIREETKNLIEERNKEKAAVKEEVKPVVEQPPKKTVEKPEVKVEIEPEPEVEIAPIKEEQPTESSSDVVEEVESKEVETEKTVENLEHEVDNDLSEPITESKSERRKGKPVKEEQADDIKGLKVVGKIEIVSEKRKKKSRKPVKTREKEETSDDVTTSKKKRKPREIDIKEESSKARDSKKTTNKRRRKSIREQISEEDVQKAIKKTLAGMEDSGSSNRSKARSKRKAERQEKEQIAEEQRIIQEKVLKLTEYVTTADMSEQMGIDINEIILKCMELGLMVTINQRLDKDTITIIADDYGFEVDFVDEQTLEAIQDIEDKEEDLEPRPPIVTIMGHVDHGKTSLLDYVRNANVVAGESGGITQHIGAYMVQNEEGKKITFLDTPGHEAFTAMRARGAQITDIVVLVVAADDNVMPQTKEAISHARAAEVPIVVAINKIDKPEANPDRIMQQLSEEGVLVEDWGGKFQTAQISAKSGKGIDVLLEKILLEADLLELRANPNRVARGTVVEAHLDRGLGPVATVVVQKGTLKQGDSFIAGTVWGRVRTMFDERNNVVNNIGPSQPVKLIGFDKLPSAGDIFMIVDSDTEARNIASERNALKREQEMRQVRHTTLDDISNQIKIGGVEILNIILKADVSGSLEALSDSLLKLSKQEVRINLLHKGVGAVTENDVNLAIASGAIIIGFQVNVPPAIELMAKDEDVEIRNYDIIYDCINDISQALEGMLKPEFKEEITSTIEVRQTFKISRMGTIAGCYVIEGKVSKSDSIRVLRNGLPVYDGKIASLKREKDDVREVKSKFECGIMLDGFNDFIIGDILESYKEVEVKRKFKN
ncbi:MAG: translation initiation factor IF-2 [Candidatus Kapaibacterium sp.]|nr:translation initiation factor IF-2 [Ignavibacteriota bacterium]MCB9220251.1 translation initiation factor IF-2 [Ignavibacteria bacterium]